MAVVRTFNRRVRAQRGKIKAEGNGLDVKLELGVESAEEYGASGIGASDAPLSTIFSPLWLDPLDSQKAVSFGSLATAPRSLNSSHKRKRVVASDANDTFLEASERQARKRDYRIHARPSKHAPTEISSKKTVSRRREVVLIPKVTHRDPRFESLSGPLNLEKVKRNYSFLDTYRASEITHLKDMLRGTRDEVIRENIERDLLRMESQQKTKAAEEQEQAVLREHRKKERSAVEKGKKPYFLKKGEVKKEVLLRRFESLGEQKIEKVIERRRKKQAAKEMRGMPDYRRGVNVDYGRHT